MAVVLSEVSLTCTKCGAPVLVILNGGELYFLESSLAKSCTVRHLGKRIDRNPNKKGCLRNFEYQGVWRFASRYCGQLQHLESHNADKKTSLFNFYLRGEFCYSHVSKLSRIQVMYCSCQDVSFHDSVTSPRLLVRPLRVPQSRQHHHNNFVSFIAIHFKLRSRHDKFKYECMSCGAFGGCQF
jgi:hypothetical protein